MKQEMSILKWASLMLEEEVKSLSAIQDVKFIKHLLWKIDNEHFWEWDSGRGTQSFAQVVTEIGKYYKQQIGTDIREFIQTLNVFKNPMDLWELLLGIAIKGSNRGNNINLILDMDHNVQAQLVGIVSSIIDKFGQGAASNKDGIADDKEEDEVVNEHHLMVDLMKQQQELTNRIIELQTELYKEQEQSKTIMSQKKELEQQIFMYKLEKASFLQTLANGNRSDSRIFDDGEETVLQTGNLTELANDIIVFVRDLRRRVNDEMEKNNLIQEELRQIKYQAVKTAEENESYLLQLGNLNIYENQINLLRQQINEVFNENALLIDRINELQEEKSKLILTLRKKKMEADEGYVDVEQNHVRVQEIIPKKKKVHLQSQNQNQENESNKGSQYQVEIKEVSRSEREESEGQKNLAKDELREPKLRTKLQRQIDFLKVSNETLKRQNSSLKLANENLQQSAKQFLISNQTIVRSWQEDFKMLMYQINQMGNEAQIQEQQQEENQEEQAQQITVEVQHQEEIVRNQNEENFENNERQYERQIEQVEREREFEKQKARQLQSKLESITQEMNRQKKIKNEHQNEVELWRQIAGKLKGLVARFRQNEINYQNTIYSLKIENAKLTKSLEQSLIPAVPQKLNKKQNLKLSISQKGFVSSVKSEKQFQIKVQMIDQELEGLPSPKSRAQMSFLSIREGEDLDQDIINKRSSQRSKFYHAESKILDQIQQNPIVSRDGELQQKYLTLNRRLFSESKASLFNLKTEFTGNEVAKSAELQARFQNEIKKIEQQYAWMNGNYQQLFRKLNIYTDQLRVKQYAKMEGMNLLKEIESLQAQKMQNKQSEIIKLTELNRHLRATLVQQATKKQQLLQIIREIESFGKDFFKNRENVYELNLQKLMTSLQEIKHSFTQSMKEPIQFLQLRLQGDSNGKAQQFYNLYSKQRQKNKQLNSELQLLTATLLEYRNILQF